MDLQNPNCWRDELFWLRQVQLVADPVNCFQPEGVVRVGLQLASQAGHVIVNRAGGRE